MSSSLRSHPAWQAFEVESAADDAWEGDPAACPYRPAAKLEAFVADVGAAATPLVIEVLFEDHEVRPFFAILALEALGREAGASVVSALLEYIDAPRCAFYVEAVVTLETIAPDLVRARGLHRKGFPAAGIVRRRTQLGFEAGMAYIEWFVRGEADEDVAMLLRLGAFYDFIDAHPRPRLRALLESLRQHRGELVAESAGLALDRFPHDPALG